MPGAGGFSLLRGAARFYTTIGGSRLRYRSRALQRGGGRVPVDGVRHKHTARPGMSLQPSTIRRDRQAQAQNHGQSQPRWVRKGGRTSVSCRSGRTGNPGPWWSG
jgi:hypothetical protein